MTVCLLINYEKVITSQKVYFLKQSFKFLQSLTKRGEKLFIITKGFLFNFRENAYFADLSFDQKIF